VGMVILSGLLTWKGVWSWSVKSGDCIRVLQTGASRRIVKYGGRYMKADEFDS